MSPRLASAASGPPTKLVQWLRFESLVIELAAGLPVERPSIGDGGAAKMSPVRVERLMRMRRREIDATLPVERAIRALIARDETPRIDLVADALGTSVRTLQRRLADAGASFKTLLDRSRLAAAVHVLQHTDAKVVDIALDLGYSEHAHFSRAFRRWMGLTPREYRRAMRTTSTPLRQEWRHERTSTRRPSVAAQPRPSSSR